VGSRSDALWQDFLDGRDPLPSALRSVFRRVPSAPRCKLCNAPFAGPGRFLSLLIGKRPWKRNPNVCGFCASWAQRRGPGGAEVDACLVFADIRGSTALAAARPPAEYRALLNRFFAAASDAIAAHEGIIDQLVGDEAIGLFVPGQAGPAFVAKDVACARAILRATGHGRAEGPWVPVGIGVHRGATYIGTVGEGNRFTDFSAVGDSVNTTARLASAAAGGEILVSAAAAAGLAGAAGAEPRRIAVKGRDEPLEVVALRDAETPRA
jgi:adenylate cyclase